MTTTQERGKTSDKNAEKTGIEKTGMLVVDLGKAGRKQIKRLRKGEGKLADRVQQCVSELKSTGDLQPSSQPVIVIVREKRRRLGLFG